MSSAHRSRPREPRRPDSTAQALFARGWARPDGGSIADVLRALVPPPAPVKPPEPTDFGHIVTDTNGVKWVLVPNHAARTGAVGTPTTVAGPSTPTST